MFNKSYKSQADKNKENIIRKYTRSFKKLCISEFKKNIKKGIDTTTVDFIWNVPHYLEEEISEQVLKELKQEYKNIEFTFSWSHYQNSYKGIKMVAI